MSDDLHGWSTWQAAPTTPIAPPPGWYPDPWRPEHHRYWDGSTWTPGSFPHGPATEPGWGEGRDAPPPGTPPPVGPVASPPPPPEWSRPAFGQWPGAGATAGWTAPRPPAPAAKRSRSPWEFVALVVAVMLVVGTLATVAGYYAFRHHSSTQVATGPPAPFSPGSATTLPADPDAPVLQSLVLAQNDVPGTYVVQTIPEGDQVDGTTTLDLCNGDFPSENLRTARLQVAAIDGQGDGVLSTEAVLYRNPAATAQAFGELKSVAAGCPPGPVDSPVGEDTTTTKFNAPPDGSWPQTPTVERLAYDFNSTDTTTGATTHAIAVYLRRGRVLMGVYFQAPDSAQPPVTGHTTIGGIAGVFAERIAKLPASVVNR